MISDKKILKTVRRLADANQLMAEELSILQKELGVSVQFPPAPQSRRRMKGVRKGKYSEAILNEKR